MSKRGFDRSEALTDEKRFSEKGFDGKTFINSAVLEKLGISEYVSVPDDNFLSIIPPPEPGHYAKRVYVHYDVGPNRSAFLCPFKMKNEPCPICEERIRLERQRDIDEETANEISALRPGMRYLFWVIDTATRKEEEKGVQLYNAPKMIQEELFALSTDRRTGEVLDASDPDDGYVLIFTRKGKGKTNTKYRGFELEKRKEPLSDEILDSVPKWDEILSYYSYDEIAVEAGLSAKPDSGSARRTRSNEDEDGGSSRRRGREETGERRSREEDDRYSRGRTQGEPEEEKSSSRRAREDKEENSREDTGRRRSQGRQEEEKSEDSDEDKAAGSSGPKEEKMDDMQERLRRRLNGGK